MKQHSRHENVDYEADGTVNNIPEFNMTDLDKIKVGCFLCHKWVPVRQTIVVVGNKDVRAHICLKHLKKLEQTTPLHQAL